MPPSSFEFLRKSTPKQEDTSGDHHPVTNLAGITIIPQKTFKDLDKATKEKIKKIASSL